MSIIFAVKQKALKPNPIETNRVFRNEGIGPSSCIKAISMPPPPGICPCQLLHRKERPDSLSHLFRRDNADDLSVKFFKIIDIAGIPRRDQDPRAEPGIDPGLGFGLRSGVKGKVEAESLPFLEVTKYPRQSV